MDSGRFLVAVVLMIATVVLVNVLFPPPRPQPRTSAVDSARSAPPAADVPAPAAPAPAPTTQPVSPPVIGTPATAAATDTIFIESRLYRFGIIPRGGALVSAEMLQHKSQIRESPVQLAVSTHSLVSHRLKFEDAVFDLSTQEFRPEPSSDLLLTDAPATLRLTRSDPASGVAVEITYSFVPDDYLVQVSVRVVGRARPTQVLLDLTPRLGANEANLAEDRRALAYVVNSRRTGIHSVPLQSMRADRIEEGPLSWVAIKNKYFVVAALQPGDGGVEQSLGGLLATAGPNRRPTNLAATLPVAANGAASYQLYIGPQEYDRLIALNQQLEDVNPYGWRWVRPIIRPLGHAFTWILLETRRATGLAYGWVLILFGIAVRLALWPLNAKAMRSQMKSMELQPRIKDIQTRLKNSPELAQKEMLKLYREEGFNPMGGCLPLLLPMPVLITLFFVFQATIEFRGVSWLWLPDLSRADPLYILPILLGVTMFIQQWLSMRTSPPNPQAKMLLWFMPAFMMVLFFNFASGLNLYYAAQNIASFPQQLQLIKERQRHMASRGLTVSVGKIGNTRA